MSERLLEDGDAYVRVRVRRVTPCDGAAMARRGVRIMLAMRRGLRLGSVTDGQMLQRLKLAIFQVSRTRRPRAGLDEG